MKKRSQALRSGLALAVALGLTAVGVPAAGASASAGAPSVAPGANAPAAGAANHNGMTWRVLGLRSDGVVSVGADAQTNAYAGDTPATASLPVLCLYVNNSPVPAGITPTFYHGWARGWVGLTPAVPGTQLTSRAAADALCATNFFAGWRMAEHHDGRYGADLSQVGGWHFWANGALPSGTRFWTAIDDQPANPWN